MFLHQILGLVCGVAEDQLAHPLAKGSFLLWATQLCRLLPKTDSLHFHIPDQNVRPLDRREYILDVTMEMENVDSSYMFWYRRVIWAQPLKFDNELYVTMHYNQVNSFKEMLRGKMQDLALFGEDLSTLS